MNGTKMGVKLMSWLCLVLVSFFVFFDIVDLVSSLRDPSNYRVIGSEGSGFWYRSKAHFYGRIVATIAGAAVAVAIPWLVSSARVVLAVRFSIAAGLVVSTIVHLREIS